MPSQTMIPIEGG